MSANANLSIHQWHVHPSINASMNRAHPNSITIDLSSTDGTRWWEDNTSAVFQMVEIYCICSHIKKKNNNKKTYTLLSEYYRSICDKDFTYRLVCIEKERPIKQFKRYSVQRCTARAVIDVLEPWFQILKQKKKQRRNSSSFNTPCTLLWQNILVWRDIHESTSSRVKP